ncbi:ATP synthase F1 subunit delta [Chloroflexota bacterium]
MVRRAYAKRYAQAIFEIALEKKELERWQDELYQIAGIVGAAGVREALENPKFSSEAKAQLISEQLPEINKLVLNLVNLLITQGKLEGLEEIVAEYRRLVNSYHGIQQAKVTTAVPLDDGQKEILADKLASLMGSKVTIESQVDTSLVGGFIARIDGKLLDGSTRSNLLALKKELTGLGEKR